MLFHIMLFREPGFPNLWNAIVWIVFATAVVCNIVPRGLNTIVWFLLFRCYYDNSMIIFRCYHDNIMIML